MTMKIIYSDEVMPCGKYEGIPVADIIRDDPNYVSGYKQRRGVAKDKNNLCFSEEAIHKARSRTFTLQPNE